MTEVREQKTEVREQKTENRSQDPDKAQQGLRFHDSMRHALCSLPSAQSIRNPQPATRNPPPETRNPIHETFDIYEAL